MKHKIFMCYRRSNKELARSIYDRLAAEFGAKAVFMDFDDVGGGREWKKRVVEALEGKPIVVTLITTVWNSRRGGRPRLLDENDHVRFELREALERELIVIPVLYDQALWPKEEQLPSELHPILRFQKVPMSQDRWEYDINELVKALRDLLGEPVETGSEQLTASSRRTATVTGPESSGGHPRPTSGRPLGQRAKTGSAPFTLTTKTQAIGTRPGLPGVYTRSMFQETAEQREQRRKEWEDRRRADVKRRKEARAREPAFLARWEFWVASLLALGMGIGALVGAEFLARGIASLVSSWTAGWSWFPAEPLPSPSILAVVLIIGLWVLARVSLSASAYWYDPELGGKVFFTRGVFGGYTLVFEDVETIGIWAAWPIATVVAWFLARIVAWIPSTLWAWSYGLVFWVALGLYTVPVLVFYVLLTVDEML